MKILRYFLFNRWTWLLFILALIPRVFDLDQFLTSDENTNIFLAGSAVVQAFLRGDFRGTYWHFYPGVTMSWADALGMAGQWLILRASGAIDISLADFVDSDIRSLLIAVRLPYALLTSLFVPVVYHLINRWLNPGNTDRIAHWLALAAALLIAFDPFFVAHSRVVHGDAPVSVFMVVSTLALFLYLRDGGQGLLFFSAMMGSLAALTKAPGQIMAPFTILVMVGNWLIVSWRQKRPNWRFAARRLIDIAVWGSLALVVLLVLWPATWVDPPGTIMQMLDETLGKVNEGHLVFFQGQPTLDPGPWFYFFVIPFRLTPLTSVGVVLSVVFLIVALFKPSRGAGGPGSGGVGERERGGVRAQITPTPLHPCAPTLILIALLWLFILIILLSGNLSPKKQDRYLLPLFPVLDILAAVGWVGMAWLIVGQFERYFQALGTQLWPKTTRFISSRHKQSYWWMGLMVLALAVAQLAFLAPYHPYYLAYFNPLMGGLSRAVDITLVGWGEGMEQVADYLNQKPNAESLYVASTPSQTLLPYFKGHGENFYTNDVALRADYVVIYRAQQQRLAPSPEIVNHFMTQEPEQVIYIAGVPYAWIFANTPLIFDDVPDWGTLANIGMGEVMRVSWLSRRTPWRCSGCGSHLACLATHRARCRPL